MLNTTFDLKSVGFFNKKVWMKIKLGYLCTRNQQPLGLFKAKRIGSSVG